MAAIALTPDDLDRYRALMLEGYTLHPDAFTSTAEERTNLPRSWWQARLQAGPIAESLAFGVIRGDELAGAAALLFESRTKTRHKATLVGMYVRDRYRGHGIGGELVASVLEAARAREGVLLVQLTVSEPNTAARRLYERHGFVQFGVEPLAMLGQCGYIANATCKGLPACLSLDAIPVQPLAKGPAGTHNG